MEPLDPRKFYTTSVLGKYLQSDVDRYLEQRDALQEQEREVDRDERQQAKATARQASKIVLEELEKKDSAMSGDNDIVPVGPAISAAVIQNPKRMRNTFLNVGRGNVVRLAGDKKQLVAGYKENSLCNTLVQDCLNRAYLATQLLDPAHARIVLARLAKAGVKNANANHADTKEISYKKAVSIALQAERWVYEAQAAAAKSMVKESKRCLHALAGKRRRTTAEKEAAYEKRGKGPRGTRTERAIKKYQTKISKLQENQ